MDKQADMTVMISKNLNEEEKEKLAKFKNDYKRFKENITSSLAMLEVLVTSRIDNYSTTKDILDNGLASCIYKVIPNTVDDSEESNIYAKIQGIMHMITAYRGFIMKSTCCTKAAIDLLTKTDIIYMNLHLLCKNCLTIMAISSDSNENDINSWINCDQMLKIIEKCYMRLKLNDKDFAQYIFRTNHSDYAESGTALIWG